MELCKTCKFRETFYQEQPCHDCLWNMHDNGMPTGYEDAALTASESITAGAIAQSQAESEERG